MGVCVYLALIDLKSFSVMLDSVQDLNLPQRLEYRLQTVRPHLSISKKSVRCEPAEIGHLLVYGHFTILKKYTS